MGYNRHTFKMKKMWTLSVVFLFMVMSLVLTSCQQQNQPISEPPIVGEWNVVYFFPSGSGIAQQGRGMYFKFQENGTMYFYDGIDLIKGSYTLSDKTLFADMYGSITKYVIKELTQRNLIISSDEVEFVCQISQRGN